MDNFRGILCEKFVIINTGISGHGFICSGGFCGGNGRIRSVQSMRGQEFG